MPASSFDNSLISPTQRDERVHDFSASSIILRWRSLNGLGVVLKHSQIAADDTGWRAELVDRE